MGEQSFVVRVWGQVQGVGFRYFTRERALQLGLRGMPTTWKMARWRS